MDAACAATRAEAIKATARATLTMPNRVSDTNEPMPDPVEALARRGMFMKTIQRNRPRPRPRGDRDYYRLRPPARLITSNVDITVVGELAAGEFSRARF
jgi:hypothetical protein